MKNLLGLLTGIVLSLVASAQHKSNIVIPDSVGTYIIEELIVKDHLAFVVLKQDSIITVLELQLKGQKQEIIIYKTEKKEYQDMITRLNEIIKIRNAQIADLKDENRKVRFRAVRLLVILIIIATVEGIALMFRQ